MTWLYAFIHFGFGAALGSFGCVVGLRAAEGRSSIFGRSMCPACRQQLGAVDIIPVLGYFLNKGRCSHCRLPIPGLYPAVEIIAGLSYAWCYVRFDYSWDYGIGLLLIHLAVIISVSDLTSFLIPNRVLLFFLPIIASIRLWHHAQPLWFYVLGSVLGGGILLLISLFSGGRLGMGDVKLFALLGWFLGLPQLFTALFLGSLLGLLTAAAWMWSGRLQRGQPIPYGPFLMFGSLIVYGYGEEMTRWYVSFVLALSPLA